MTLKEIKERLEHTPVMVKHLSAIGLIMGMWWTGYYVGERSCSTAAEVTISKMRKQLESSEERLRQLEQENFYDHNWRSPSDEEQDG